MSYLSEGPPFVVNTFHWRKGEREEFLTTEVPADQALTNAHKVALARLQELGSTNGAGSLK